MKEQGQPHRWVVVVAAFVLDAGASVAGVGEVDVVEEPPAARQMPQRWQARTSALRLPPAPPFVSTLDRPSARASSSGSTITVEGAAAFAAFAFVVDSSVGFVVL